MEIDLEKGLPEEVNMFMDGWEYLHKVAYEKLPFKCRKCHEYGHFVKRFPKEVTNDPGKSQEEGWQHMKRGKKAPNNSPNVNNDHHPGNSKEHVTTAKDTDNNNPFIALHIKEGEILAADITLEGEESEEGGDPESSTLPNASGDGTEKALAGSSSPSGSWATMVKKSIPNPMVESPGHSSSQGSQEILDQAPPPSTRGRKMHRNHRE